MDDRMQERLRDLATDMAEHFNDPPEVAVEKLREAVAKTDMASIWWLIGFAQGWFAALEKKDA